MKKEKKLLYKYSKIYFYILLNQLLLLWKQKVDITKFFDSIIIFSSCLCIHYNLFQHCYSLSDGLIILKSTITFTYVSIHSHFRNKKLLKREYLLINPTKLEVKTKKKKKKGIIMRNNRFQKKTNIFWR